MNLAMKSVIVFIVLAGLLLTGCATRQTTPEEIVKERAQARWDALLSRDFATAYEYYSPGYRSKFTPVDFEIEMRLRKVKLTSATFQDLSCAENSCTLNYRIGYQVGAPVPGISSWTGYDYMEDQWIKTGGQWWYLPEEK